MASALLEFGQTLVDQNRDLEARPLFERARTIREAALGANNPDVAEVLSALANTLAHLGQSARALELSRHALDIWNQSQSPDVLHFAQSLLVHASILQARGDVEQAIGAVDRALDLKLGMLGQSHPEIAQARAAKASLLAMSGQRDEALLEAMRAEETGREHLRLMLRSLPVRQALEYAAARPRGLDLALSLVVDRQSRSTVFDSLIRGRALVLDEEASRVRAIANEPPELASLRAKLTSARQRLANLMIRGQSGESAEEYARLLFGANQDKEEGERALADESASFRGELSRASVGLDQVRRQLPSGSALVSFVTLQSK